MQKMLAQSASIALPDKKKWLDWCLARRKRYPVVQPEYWHLKEKINPYCFMHTLSELLAEKQINKRHLMVASRICKSTKDLCWFAF